MNKKLIVIGLMSLLILAGCQQKKAEVPPASASPEAATKPKPKPSVAAVSINYTDEGYKPANTTIKAGTVVTFVNLSSNEMWTASAVHPTHGEYPQKGGCIGSAFDECRPDGRGSTWSFQFDEVGTWGYHNHMKPSDKGTIVVIR